MKHTRADGNRSFFKVLLDGDSSQAATMMLKPGQSSSDEIVNEHPRCEQWLYVLSGTGRARVEKRSVALKTGSLLLIEKGEAHRITNTARKPLVTLNLYAPPAYTKADDVKTLAKVPTLKTALGVK